MILIRTGIRRRRRRIAVLAAVGLAAAVIAWQHLGPQGHEMEEMEGMALAASVCLAVIQGFALAPGSAGWWRPRRCRPRRSVRPQTSRGRYPSFGVPPARAGPSTLQVFRC